MSQVERGVNSDITRRRVVGGILTLPLTLPSLLAVSCSPNPPVGFPPPVAAAGEHPLAKILMAGFGTPERKALERQHVSAVTSTLAIDLAFWVISDPKIRLELLEKRAKVRAEQRTGLSSFFNSREISSSLERAKWATEHRMFPEVLEICREVFLEARKVVEIVEGTDPKNENGETRVDTRMINPGGMADLMSRHSGEYTPEGIWYGFCYLGKTPASKVFNPEQSRAAKAEFEALYSYSELLAQETGLPYHPNNFPADEKWGTIGLGFTPQEALSLHSLLKRVGVKFNVFEPKSALLGRWVQIAQAGYQRGDEDRMLNALASVEPHLDQREAILGTASDYWNNFVQGNYKAY